MLVRPDLEILRALFVKVLVSGFVFALTRKTKSSTKTCRSIPLDQSLWITSSAAKFQKAGAVRETWRHPFCCCHIAGPCGVLIATFLLERISLRGSRVLLWYCRFSRLFLIEVYYRWSNAPLMSKEIIRACWLLFFTEFILSIRSIFISPEAVLVRVLKVAFSEMLIRRIKKN
ncbi:hypothetical protein AVEN_115032-1 [Araneus ventricosus]|uniref:Uncharacterized protein n=1 Tax=Araneus ventricosus TaxID=182803 RepID=A0A4Y1ZXT9_ARAVE|nr:hypothetical protein AVEN_115032-1 [Araneus ventricosus]